jgi:SAM-dependent methyltransferase
VVRDGDRVLDVGAHDRALGAEIERRGLRAEYRSVDPDPSTEHDHASIRDVNEAFDVVILLEVIEHLPLDAAVALMRDCAQRVAPGGWFVVSTPNVHHPTWFWRDPSHITAFRYTDLLGILHYLGLRDFEVARVKRLRWRDRLRAWRYRGLLKLLSADFAPGIVVRCRRPAG